MPFIPPNPRLDLLPPEDRERAYREQRELLEQLSARYRFTGWLGLLLLVAVIAIVAASWFSLPSR
jgi:uncharacterized membrane protein